MSFNPEQFREQVVIPTLEHLDLYSESATELLMLTAAVESNLGEYLVQLGGGPARGVYQMEPATEQDIWENFLRYRRDLASLVECFDEDLVLHLGYATAMARVHYLRVPEALPKADDVQGLARYWKKYYNTNLGKGSEEKAVEAYGWFVQNV